MRAFKAPILWPLLLTALVVMASAAPAGAAYRWPQETVTVGPVRWQTSAGVERLYVNLATGALRWCTNKLTLDANGNLALAGTFTPAGVLKIANGTAALPGLAPASDLDSGVARLGPNDMSLSAGGVTGVEWTTTAVTLPLPTTFSDVARIANGTAALPGLTPASDPDSGIARAGSNDMTLNAGGVTGFEWTATATTLPLATTFSSTVQGPGTGDVTYSKHFHVAIANVNSGATLLAAVTGRKYRLVTVKLIAVGGNLAHTANATGVDVLGTQTTPVALFFAPLATLTRSAVVSWPSANVTYPVDAAQFNVCDATTAITIQAHGGSDLITSTYIDGTIEYAME